MQWWAAILENVSIKATPIHSLWRKRSNKAIQFFWNQKFPLDEAIKSHWNGPIRSSDTKIGPWNGQIQLADTKIGPWNGPIQSPDKKIGPFLHDEAIHSFKIRSMKRHRETIVLRAVHWQGILLSSLGQEGSESPGWLPLADLASACLEQLIRTPPPLTHVFHLLLSCVSIVGPVHLSLLCLVCAQLRWGDGGGGQGF